MPPPQNGSRGVNAKRPFDRTKKVTMRLLADRVEDVVEAANRTRRYSTQAETRSRYEHGLGQVAEPRDRHHLLRAPTAHVPRRHPVRPTFRSFALASANDENPSATDPPNLPITHWTSWPVVWWWARSGVSW